MVNCLNYRLKKTGYGLLALLALLSVVACSQSVLISERPASEVNSEALVVLWDKGYVIEEDEAIRQVVEDWVANGGLPVKLSFFNSGETAPKTLRASRSGASPDILFAAKSVYPVSEWEGRLADVTDVVAPLADSYTADALQAAKVYGSEKSGSQKGDRYYAVPLNQSTIHIYYWKDLLQEAGYTPEDIPTDWDGFWRFWQQVQTNLSDNHPNLRSIGLPYSADATDTYHAFEQVLAAYDVKLLDDSGNLRLDDPKIKSRIAQCLDWYLQFYREGYVPESAVNWLDPENNRNLLDRDVVMTPNPTMSIPAAVRNDEDIYFKKLGSIEFPNTVRGLPSPHFVSIRQAVVFNDAPHQQAAKDFLSYLVQPEVLNTFLKTSYGRYVPPGLSQIEADDYWHDSNDPHVSTVIKTITEGRTLPSYNALNPDYGTVMERNIWGQIIHKMAVDKLSAQQAAEEAIEAIEAIFRDRL
ncbi:Bacterial extracellular solute-binding protein, putative [Synechococcus sp. PCC 7335]|uniref:ABC transporter substrate-binding protein n=1 Tax=Synechococcus sp. (strain ATCC 29403 / PCC 7335) TaxID=91464 RepID=UPI00017EE7E8|nr:ABC transporter substrate-binding protein [Synechococcus sp. PCC 7335]EDX86093.1 Bacterial extracellular solute-binding protein, putative [Synechococcus sp. PCC 7335]